MIIPDENVDKLADFMIERHKIYVDKSNGLSKPWTTYPILQDYRFCNVYRELDTVTQWIDQNWRMPNEGREDLWFAMAVARWVNWPDSLEQMGFPLPWNPKKFIETLHARKAAGDKVWTGAYMIGTQGNAMDKASFIATGVLQPLWDNRKELRPKKCMTLEQFARPIINTKNQGTFMVGQIVADIKYVDPLLGAEDWWTWAVSGPGSRRGLNRVVGREINKGWNDKEFSSTLTALLAEVSALLPAKWMPRVHAQDLQNCLCEWDKYERVRLGQGRPRNRYAGR